MGKNQKLDWKKDTLYDESRSFCMIDLARVVEWKQVHSALKYFYPDGKWGNKYEELFNRIKNARKRKYTDPDPIEIVVGGDRNIKPTWVSGTIMGEFYSCGGLKYGLSFQKWNRLFNMPITRETIEHYKSCEILAHFIWEITWYGMEEETQKIWKEMNNDLTKIKKNESNKN